MVIRLFATLKDRAGVAEITVVTADELSVRELRAQVAQQYPRLAELAVRSVVSVNREFAFNEDRVRANDEVALFPPVSGGAGPARRVVAPVPSP
jgi:molybdopterin synthase catalytic subunit